MRFDADGGRVNIGFYAPLKSPYHPVPSGDRYIARGLMAALRAAGHRPRLMSEVRTWEGLGDLASQARIKRRALRALDRLKREFDRDPASRPELWFTYHVYHRAPDWLGPAIADYLTIPYVVAEASYAPKQTDGPWRDGCSAARDAIVRADAVISLNTDDRPMLERLRNGAGIYALRPFLVHSEVTKSRDEARTLAAAQWALPPEVPWITVMGMMRGGRKQASFELAAKLLGSLRELPFHAIVVGDGPFAEEIRQVFSSALGSRATFTGLLDRDAIDTVLRGGDVFLWPAVDEPIGMVLLEAQAQGLPVVAIRNRGVRDIVCDGMTGFLADGEAELRSALHTLVSQRAVRDQMGMSASAHVRDHHSLASAALRLDESLRLAMSAHEH
jgi:glycosyltransferase involved in cell wall biosynthesis